MASSASAAAGETPKQLLSIIRDFASEKSQGERRVSDLKRRLGELRAAADAASAELDAAKQAREAAEQELRGAQVQAAIADASIQALKATISHLQEEISKAGSHLDALECKADKERDEFVSQMHEMNVQIRQFQQMASLEIAEDNHSGLPSTEGQHVGDKNEAMESEGILKDLADKVNNIDAKVLVLEGEYKKDLLEHDKIRQELADVQSKRALMEAVLREMKQLQEIGGYPIYVYRAVFCAVSLYILSQFVPCFRGSFLLTRITRTAELEKVQASLAEELQRRYTCPDCGVNNVPALEEAAAN